MPVRQKVDCTFEDVWIEPMTAQIMSAVIQDRERNLFLEGLQGVGKSTIARALSMNLDWEFRKIQGSQIKKFTTMYGRTLQVRQRDGNVIWQWFDSPLVRNVREAKKRPDREFLFMVDEYTRIDEDARDAFLEVIEGKDRALTLPNTEVITLPNNIHWMAAGNVGDSFTVKDQDAANTDRWIVVEIGHMPLDVEIRHCAKKFPRCPRAELEKGLGVIDKLRKIVFTKMRLTNTVSTRQSENMAFLLGDGIPLEHALRTAVANQFRGKAKDEASERGRVNKKITEALQGIDIAAA